MTVVAQPTATSEIVTVTPELAEQWLAHHNRCNRTIREGKVASYARDMQSGRWLFNGDAIRFAADGTLLDGQHRLTAVIRAGVPFETVVVRGLRNATQETMDIGAHRTLGDALHLRGESNAAMLGAVARRALRFKAGNVATGGRTHAPTNAEMSAYIEENPSIRRAAEVGVRSRTSVPVAPSVIGTAYLLAAELSFENAEYFYVTQLIDCVGLREGDPARALLRRFQHEATVGGRQIDPDDAFRYCIVAWNHYRAGRQISKMQAPKGGWGANSMPIPK